jgi:hypothetical protein
MATLYVGCEEAVFQCKMQNAKCQRYHEQIALQDQPAGPAAANPGGLRFPCGGRAYGHGCAAHGDIYGDSYTGGQPDCHS